MSRTGPARIPATAGVLAAALAAAAAGSLAMAALGGRMDGEAHFLRNYRAPSDYEAHLALAMDYAERSSEANDVLLLGDSTALNAFDPAEFQARTGLRAYNLATVGIAGFEGFDLLLRRYLRSHPAPRLVVLAVHPWALGVDAERTGSRDVRRHFLRTYLPASAEARMPPLKRLAQQVRLGWWSLYGAVTGGLSPRMDLPIPRRGGDSFRTLAGRVRAGRGFSEQPGRLEPGPRQPGEAGAAYPVLPYAEEGVERILATAAARGLRVLIRLTPVLEEGPEPQSAPVEAWLARVAAAHPAASVGRPEVLVYAPAEFGEYRHLNRRGASRFTARVAEDAGCALALPIPEVIP